MSQPGPTPGPIAETAFRSGFKIAAIVGLACVGLLFWTDTLSSSKGAHVLFTLLLFPVYLLLAATVLGKWLGYGTDEANLVRVTETVETESGKS